jgi:hypothetical protein
MSRCRWVIVEPEADAPIRRSSELDELLDRELRAQFRQLSPSQQQKVVKALKRRQGTGDVSRIEVGRRVEKAEPKREPTPLEVERRAREKRLKEKRKAEPAELRLSRMLARGVGGETEAVLVESPQGDVTRLRDGSNVTKTSSRRAGFRDVLADQLTSYPDGTRRASR